MSKICGLVTNRADARLNQELERILAESRQPGFVRENHWNDGTAALGHLGLRAVDRRTYPVFSPDKQCAAVACGQLFDTSPIRDALRREGVELEEHAGEAALVTAIVRAGREDLLAQLNGVFACAVWEADAGRLHLVTDRMGFRLLYYHHDESTGELTFSSDIRGVLAGPNVPRRVDWQACSTYVHLGHHVGERTKFEGVLCLPPGTALRWMEGRIALRRYWDPASLQIRDGTSWDDAIDGSIERFSTAIQRRWKDISAPQIVFLSGGLDSRRIAAELKRQGCDFHAYTTRGFSAKDKDRPIAAEVASILGVPHTMVNLPDRGFASHYWPRANRLTEYEVPQHQWVLPLVDALPKGGLMNYDGIAGDIAMDGAQRASPLYAPESFLGACAQDRHVVARSILGCSMDLSHLSPELRHRLTPEAAVVSIAEELRRYETSGNHITLFYLFSRTRRGVCPFSLKVVLPKAECMMPFLDHDYIEFVMSLPLEIRTQHILRNRMVERAYPRLAEVAYTANANAPRRKSRGADIRLTQQRRDLVRNGLRNHILARPWVFSRKALPRALSDLMRMRLSRRHVSHVCNHTLLTFYEWLATYFPGGLPN
jgi:asparagine synthase (glutamine-hydrolysing)